MNSIPIINGKLNPLTQGVDFSEMNNVIEDESGYRIELHEVLSGQISLKWGKYNNPSEKVLSFHPDKTTVVSHFRITDPSPYKCHILISPLRYCLKCRPL